MVLFLLTAGDAAVAAVVLLSPSSSFTSLHFERHVYFETGPIHPEKTTLRSFGVKA